MMNLGKQSICQHLALILFCLQQLANLQVQAALTVGEGHLIMLNRGSLLQDELDVRKSGADLVFQRKSPRVSEVDEYDEFVELVKRWRIDVFWPGKGLTHLMNVVSTNVFGRLLVDFDGAFTRLKLDSVSRPKLKTYLSLQEATQEEISKWSKLRGARGYDNYCQELLEKRDEEFRNSFGDNSSEEHVKMLKLAKKLRKQDPYHLAHLVFHNNLNLFKLENFLILCNRLQLNEEVRKAFTSYSPLF